jgi:hypothetical protein
MDGFLKNILRLLLLTTIGSQAMAMKSLTVRLNADQKARIELRDDGRVFVTV